MKKLLLLALAGAVALTASPAFASVQNVKIGGSVDSTYILRENFDFGSFSEDDEYQSVFITQTLLSVDADLTDQVSARISLGNEQAWGENDGNVTELQVYEAYAILREMLYSPLTVYVGRQYFGFGNNMVFSTGGTNNSGGLDSGIASVAGDLTKLTTQDAIRLVFDYNPLTLTAFRSIPNSNTTAINSVSDDVVVNGLYATYDLGDERGSSVEAYLFIRSDDSTEDDAVGSKADILKIPGVRLSTNPFEGLYTSLEFAWQSGRKVSAVTSGVTQERHAAGVQFISNYSLPVLEEYNPVVGYVFSKFTSDDSLGGNNTEYNGWDPFYEEQALGTIYNAIFNQTGYIMHSLSLSVNPMEDVSTKLTVSKFWTEKENKNDNVSYTLVQPDGDTSTTTNLVGDKSVLGTEVDFEAMYDYTEDVQIGLNFGIFKPGPIFYDTASSGADKAAKQLLVNLNVQF